MKASPTSRLAAIHAALFETPSQQYTLLAMVALVGGAAFVFGGHNAPDLVTYMVMLLTLLAASRMFAPQPLRSFWYVVVGLIVLVLALDLAVLLVAY
ncbi:hypothetical protein [Hymenobacter sp. B81]|uniref:hypothetical protein n=1 Tax=Hymenobacter sp. B81 TaxID=3344878 RepID=UPI0037DDDE03